jgi:phenylpropionate dioxygenase-like ring-hydroxylating dioxygenase large terminal subunit
MNYWHLVAHQCELARSGDFVNLPWCETGNIVVSNIDGELVAWNGLCSHRRYRIYTEMSGNAPPVCGYHGRCQKPSKMRVRFPVLVTEDGWVLVYGKDVPLSSAPAPSFEPICETPRLRLYNTVSYTYQCLWAVAVENALEAEHVPFVHADSLGKLGISRCWMHLAENGSSIELFESTQKKRLDRIQHLFPNRPVDLACDYAHAYYFPHAALSTTRGWSFSLQNYFPKAGGMTTFVHRLYVTDTDRDMTNFWNGVASLNEQIFREDAAVCARVTSDSLNEPEPAEDRIRHFRDAMDQG